MLKVRTKLSAAFVRFAAIRIVPSHDFHTKMKVTEKDVAYVAELANLELTESERKILLRDLNSILDYMDRLNQLDTTDVPPMAQVSDRYGVDRSKTGSSRFAYASREDILEGLRKSLPHEVALRNAPDSDGTFFKVPKVIER
jgi:aspartyl-tRNA(Asn)/glutamyl-tRNA(Gln) amidotransferase subunit C